MKMSSLVPAGRIRHLLIALAVSALAGCSLVPGNQSYSDRDESAVMLPVQQGDALVPAHIKIQPITAELIVDMFKAARPPIGDGTSVARKATESAPRSGGKGSGPTPEYKLGPGFIESASSSKFSAGYLLRTVVN